MRLTALAHTWRAALVITALCLNLLPLPTLALLCSLLLRLVPSSLPKLQKILGCCIDLFATWWVGVNSFILKTFLPITLHMKGQGECLKNQWSVVICNHQSWADILILDWVFHGKLPKLRFFMKRALIWQIPIAGLACWAMGYPMIHRPSKAALKKNPRLRAQITHAITQACSAARIMPSAIALFPESTRFTPAKHQQKNSPYRHLLEPQPIGLAGALNALQDVCPTLVDVTLAASDTLTLPRLLSGQPLQLYVYYEVITLDNSWFGDIGNDRLYRQQFRQRLQKRWQEKDARMQQSLTT